MSSKRIAIVISILIILIISLGLTRNFKQQFPEPEKHHTQSSPRTEFNQRTNDGQASTSLEHHFQITDFNFIYSDKLRPPHTKTLSSYRLSFLTDSTVSRHQIEQEEVTELARRLKIKEPPVRLLPGTKTNWGKLPEPYWVVGNAEPAVLMTYPYPPESIIFLRVDANTGSFEFGSGDRCQRGSRELSLSEAKAIAVKFVSERLSLQPGFLDTTPSNPSDSKAFFKPPSYENCFIIFFTNRLPIDNLAVLHEFAPFLSSRGAGGIHLPAAYNTNGYPHDGLSVMVDPTSGKVAFIVSEYLRLSLLGEYPVPTLSDIGKDLTEGHGRISDLDFQQDQVKRKDGRVDALITAIYLDYIPEWGEPCPGCGRKPRLGGSLKPLYYLLAEIPLLGPQPHPGHLLIELPALQGD